jgi:hypothetical protein
VRGAIFGGARRDEDYLAGKSIECCYVPSIFLAIGRCATPCARAAGKAGTTAADTARRSCRRSPCSRVIATAAATTPRARRVISRTRCAEQDAGSDKRLIKRSSDPKICQPYDRQFAASGLRRRRHNPSGKRHCGLCKRTRQCRFDPSFAFAGSGYAGHCSARTAAAWLRHAQRARAKQDGGRGRTRTYEGVSQRIYSPPPLPLGTLSRTSR